MLIRLRFRKCNNALVAYSDTTQVPSTTTNVHQIEVCVLFFI
ncbi:hypothetical protein Hanom_Chr01g00006951 [Helianthus anomalus]